MGAQARNLPPPHPRCPPLTARPGASVGHARGHPRLFPYRGAYDPPSRDFRASMSATRRRTTTKLLRLHPEELARIAARAQACGQTPARFIRETALGATPKARQHLDAESVLRTLGRLARSRGDAVLAQRLADALEGHKALVEQVVHDGRPRSRQASR